MDNGLFAPNPHAGMSHPERVDLKAQRDENLRRAGRGAVGAAKGLLFNFTPAGDVDFANDLRKKVEAGEEISTFDKVMAASMAVPFIPSFVRRGGKKAEALVKAMRGDTVKFKMPEGVENSTMRIDLLPDALDPKDRAAAELFNKRASDLFEAEARLRKQGIPVSGKITEVARNVEELRPYLDDKMSEVEVMNTIARGRDAHANRTLGGMDVRVEPDALVVESTDQLAPMLLGKGHGKSMYGALLGKAQKMNKNFVESDGIVSHSAARVWDALARMGIQVTRNPAAYNTGTHWVTEARSGPVFRVDVTKPHMFGEKIDDLLTHKGAFDDIL